MVPLDDAYSSYDDTLTYADDTIVLFWTPPSAFSQWMPSPFTVEEVLFNCSEQYIMASKARLFNDRVALAAIMATNEPQTHKRLGRQVRNFDENV